ALGVLREAGGRRREPHRGRGRRVTNPHLQGRWKPGLAVVGPGQQPSVVVASRSALRRGVGMNPPSRRRTDPSGPGAEHSLAPGDAVAGDFERERRSSIRRLGKRPGLRSRSVRWMRDVSRYAYSYHFTWMGRPIIQFPQDILAVQEIVWNVKPDL